jgi:hypothetical protein
MHVYEVRPRKDHRGVDLISDARIRRGCDGIPFVAPCLVAQFTLTYDASSNAIEILC